MIKFLGSLSFALILIGCTLLFAIAGTLIESVSGSHQFAALFTYQNPFFRLLLWLYFVNILFSSLSRMPFQKKHLPFLSTHLGLLLLLVGLFCKNHFGLQGVCALSEGSGTSQILIPNSYALQIESPDKRSLIRLKPKKLGPLSLQHDDLELTLIEWTPHVEEKIEAIISFNAEGKHYTADLNQDAIYIYDKGYGGYAAFAKLPPNHPQSELIAPLTRSWRPLPLPTKREEATPRIRLLASSATHSEIGTFAYDKYGQKFKWPILGGSYLLRFQSHLKQLPIHLRLHSAQQINYPGTTTPYSYEAKLSFDSQEAILSMNHVYEKKGYRFYLANMIPAASGIQQVQIVVNYDPTKYFLTYPGAFFLVLGILLLYVKKRIC